MRLLTARWTPGLPPLCHDDTRIKLGKERGPYAEQLCSSHEALFSFEKAAVACLCNASNAQVVRRDAEALQCSALARLKNATRSETKESSFTHLAKGPGVGSRSTRLWRWRTWRDVSHRERFVTFVGRVAGKRQQNAAGERSWTRWRGLFLLHKGGCRPRTDLRYERVLYD